MKKIFRLIAALAAATVAFSCMEEANPEVNSQDGGTHYEGPMVTLTFSVEELTKTSYDKENGHQWSEGDQIKIVWGAEDNAYVVADVVEGKVIAEVGDVETYYAVYPENAEHTFITPEGQTEKFLTVVIPQTQDGSFKQANIMAAKTSATEMNFQFKNLTHIIKFTLSEDSAYKGFQFMTNSSTNMHVTGGVPVSFDEFSIGADTTVTVNGTKYPASSIVQVGDLAAGGTYYVGIHPAVDMSNGFGFKATKSAGTTGWSEGALSTGAVDTDRLKITSITNLDKAIRTDWFFKEEATGKGDGSCWENAGDVNLLVKLLGKDLKDDVTYNKNTNGWRLYGAKLHLAAGVYELPATIEFLISVNNKTAIYGGYPTNLTGTSLEGRDVTDHETIITKNGGTRLFYSNGSNLYDWTWDGITFTLNEGKTSTQRGGVFYLNNSTKGTLKFNDCTFRNVESTDTNGGGVFCINTEDNVAKITFTNCDFLNNKTAKVGGAVFVQDGRAATLTFKDCDFTGNTATSAGGAIGNCVGTIIINGCTFSNNSSSNHGAAICAYGESPISGVSVPSGENYANVYVYNTLFTKNDVSNHQGGAIKIHGKTNLALVNSTLHENVAKDGIIRLRSGSTSSIKAWIISCTFSGNNKYSLYNQSSDAYIYNTIMDDPTSYTANQAVGGASFWNSVIYNSKYYNITSGELAGKALVTTLTDMNELEASVVDTFDSDNGVYSVIGAAQTTGMSSEALAALGAEGSALMTAMPLFDASKLTVDQKGKSRAGKTIMGAYVGE